MTFKKSTSLKLFLTIFIALFSTNETTYAKETIEEKKEKKKYKGSLDAGANFSNGNSKEQSIQSNFEFTYNFNEKTSNIFKSRADNKKLNKVRTRERYYVNNQTRNNIDKHNFKFLEIEYISDRYGGYHYRTSETAGLGRKLIDSDRFQLTVQSSAGMRQIKLTTDDKRNDIVLRIGSNFSASINDSVSFEEDFDISSDQNATIIRSDSNLRVLLSKKLYFKFGVLIQRVSNVPAGRKNSDVTTGLKLGYEF